MAFMVTLQPLQAIETLERALRQLMAHAFRQRYGPGWLESISTSDQRSKWQAKRDQERDRRAGVVVSSEAGLEFTELYELLQIAWQHWEFLGAVLGKRKSFTPLADIFLSLAERAEGRRNTVSHNRPLVPFEIEMLSGIAGLVRNQVTLAMSSADPSGDIYPRIEDVADSFGNHVELDDQFRASWERTGVTLAPGDVVTFTCVGHDPQDRRLRWKASISRSAPDWGLRPKSVESASGEPARLEWKVNECDVKEEHHVWISMESMGSAGDGITYHREGDKDQRVCFTYRVRPA